KSAPCPLYPQYRTLGGTSKSAFWLSVYAYTAGRVLINEHCLSLALPALLHLEDLIRSQSARTHFVFCPPCVEEKHHENPYFHSHPDRRPCVHCSGFRPRTL